METFFLFTRMIAALLLILALIFISLKIGSPYLSSKNFSGNKILTVIERLSLSPKTAIYVVKAGEDYFLLGINGDSITYLKEVSQDSLKNIDLKELDEPQGKDFKDVLNSKLLKKVKDKYENS